MHIVSQKDKGCVILPFASVFSKPWLRCFQSRPCFSMGRSLSSDRKSTILSGKWECTGGETGSLGTWGLCRQTPSGSHTHPLPSAQHKQRCWALTAPNTHTHTSKTHLQTQLCFILWLISFCSALTLSAKSTFSVGLRLVYSSFLFFRSPQTAFNRVSIHHPSQTSPGKWAFKDSLKWDHPFLVEKDSRTICLKYVVVSPSQGYGHQSCLRFDL